MDECELLICKIKELLNGFYGDNGEFIIAVDPIKRITLDNYMRAIVHIDVVKNSLEAFSRTEYFKQKKVTMKVGYSLIYLLEEAYKNDLREEKRIIIDLIRTEIDRIYKIYKIKDGFVFTLSSRTGDEILNDYFDKYKEKYELFNNYFSQNKIVSSKPAFTKISNDKRVY